MLRGLIHGIVLWAALSLVFKLVIDGDLVAFSAGTIRALLPSFSVLLATAIALGLRISRTPFEAMRTGLHLAIPGMILGSATLLMFGRLIAQPSMEHGIVYAVFMLWTYGLILAGIALFCDGE